MSRLLERFRRKEADDAKVLEGVLKSVTDSGVIEIPKDLLSTLTERTSDEDNRRQIMAHLRQCLREPLGKRWRRVYAGLVLTDTLLQSGSPQLVNEMAQGSHFDLMQQLCFLECYQNTDKRAKTLICNKAHVVRAELTTRLNSATPAVEEIPKEAKEAKEAEERDNASTCTGQSGPGQMILNGIVVVGHTDDTTSESSDGEAQRAVRYRTSGSKKPRSARERQQAQQRDVDDSGSDGCADSQLGKQRPLSPKPPPAPAASVDLLDLM